MGQLTPLLIPCWIQPGPTHPVWACRLLGTSTGRLGAPRGSNMGLLRGLRWWLRGHSHRLSPAPEHHPARCWTSSVWASGVLTDLCQPSHSANLGQLTGPTLGPAYGPLWVIKLPCPGTIPAWVSVL